MRLILVLISLPFLGLSQHKSVSYQLQNEVGTHVLHSYTFNHELDNTEGVSFVIEKRTGDTVYQINRFLNGWVALNNNGRTICHLVTERGKEPLDESLFILYRDGKQIGSAMQPRLVNYELQMARVNNKIPRSGWLRKDSVFHQMAEHPFYVTEDKLFMSFDIPKLVVFDLNQLVQIYTGNGANHFAQNYYSLPNPPYRIELESEKYFPKGLPKTLKGKSLAEALADELKLKATSPSYANYRVDVEFLLKPTGELELRESSVSELKSNAIYEEKSEALKQVIPAFELDISTIPPNHPAWVFKQTLWFK